MNAPPYAIDVLAVFFGRLTIRGWVAAPSGSRLQLEIGDRSWPLPSWGLSSPDVAADIPGAVNVRFDDTIKIGDKVGIVQMARLVLILPDGQALAYGNLAATADPTRELKSTFGRMLAERPTGTLLELGSRARSGVVNTGIVPQGWRYVGLDIREGPNVDRVGDAHALSTLFPDQRFDAVMSFSVIEHLLMPWKVAIELNRVMNVGAIGLFTTHQGWPLHDAPWDFWRFSRESWNALFNDATGFRVVAAEIGEPGYVVAQRCHAATNFGDQPIYLSSVVMFEKTRETNLSWDVSLSDVIKTEYPTGELPTVE